MNLALKCGGVDTDHATQTAGPAERRKQIRDEAVASVYGNSR